MILRARHRMKRRPRLSELEFGHRPIDAMVRAHNLPTIPAPRMTEQENYEHQRRLEERRGRR